MLRRILLSAALIAGCAAFARADGQDDVKAAFQKLADAPNYSWKSTTEGGFGAGETDGKTQKDGLTTLSITRQDNTTEAVVQGDKAAIKTDDGWKSASEAVAAGAGGGPQRFTALMLQNYKTPVAQAQEAMGNLQNCKKTDDAYSADLSEEAAKRMLAFRPRRNPNADANAAPQVSNAKASVSVWIADGIVTKVQTHVTGTVSFNGNDRDIDRTTTTVFSDVGSTKVTVPDEAKAKLTAPPATQP